MLQHHIDSGGVNNIVGAAASGPDEEPSATADMWLPLAQSPAVNIGKRCPPSFSLCANGGFTAAFALLSSAILYLVSMVYHVHEMVSLTCERCEHPAEDGS